MQLLASPGPTPHIGNSSCLWIFQCIFCPNHFACLRCFQKKTSFPQSDVKPAKHVAISLSHNICKLSYMPWRQIRKAAVTVVVKGVRNLSSCLLALTPQKQLLCLSFPAGLTHWNSTPGDTSNHDKSKAIVKNDIHIELFHCILYTVKSPVSCHCSGFSYLFQQQLMWSKNRESAGQNMLLYGKGCWHGVAESISNHVTTSEHFKGHRRVLKAGERLTLHITA